jgi:hypothetical protein
MGRAACEGAGGDNGGGSGRTICDGDGLEARGTGGGGGVLIGGGTAFGGVGRATIGGAGGLPGPVLDGTEPLADPGLPLRSRTVDFSSSGCPMVGCPVLGGSATVPLPS